LQESNVFSSLCHNSKDDQELQSSLREKLNLQDAADVIFSPTVEFEDVDIDGEIDPALKEEIDR
jgi:S-phase kinase-associated protein 1